MRKMIRFLAAGLATIMSCSMLTGCGGGSSDKKASSDKDSSKGSVYYLNFKPEADEQWQELAKEYTDETGVPVTVVTAAANQYETTLKSEMGKSEAPTLFQVNGPVGLASWKDYCYDLKDSDVAKQLTSDDFALMDGDKMSGIAYVIESYGIIYNKELLKKAGIPVVVLTQDYEDGISIIYDDYHAGKAMGEHIGKKGHQKVGYIGVYETDKAVGTERRNGVLD